MIPENLTDDISTIEAVWSGLAALGMVWSGFKIWKAHTFSTERQDVARFNDVLRLTIRSRMVQEITRTLKFVIALGVGVVAMSTPPALRPENIEAGKIGSFGVLLILLLTVAQILIDDVTVATMRKLDTEHVELDEARAVSEAARDARDLARDERDRARDASEIARDASEAARDARDERGAP